MYQISKTFSFCAAHYLDGYQGPCGHTHGHNFEVVLMLEAEALNDIGFVREFRELDRFKQFLDDTLDHSDLNTVLRFNPTTENLTRYLFEIAKQMFPEVAEVRVSETPKTWVSYREIV